VGGGGNGDVCRRTWEKAAFARRAAERREQEEHEERELKRKRRANEEKSRGGKDADTFAPTRAWLLPREGLQNLDGREGSQRLVSHARDVKSGFYCAVCDALLKDSTAYLNHLNGRPHQEKLGMSMRVKRNTKEDVLRALRDDLPPTAAASSKPKERRTRGDASEHNHVAVESQSKTSQEVVGGNAGTQVQSDLGLPLAFGSSKSR